MNWRDRLLAPSRPIDPHGDFRRLRFAPKWSPFRLTADGEIVGVSAATPPATTPDPEPDRST